MILPSAARLRPQASVLPPFSSSQRVARPCRRPVVTAVLDPFALAAAAAAASSLLTAAWIRAKRRQERPYSSPATAHQQEQEEPEPRPPAPAEAETVQQVWEAAWAAFNRKQQQAEEAAPCEGEAVASRPMLLLQGIKGAARAQLLALSLAALEQQIAQLAPAAAAVLTAAQWRHVCAALLAQASLAVARAWLGYVPQELREAVQVQCGALDPSALAAAGIASPVGQSSAAADASQARVPVDRGGGASSVGWLDRKRHRHHDQPPGSIATAEASGGGGSSSSSDGGGSVGAGGARRSSRIDNFYWVGLEERVGLYCSVLRLLRSHSIQESPAQQGNGGTEEAAAPEVTAEVPQPSPQHDRQRPWWPGEAQAAAVPLAAAGAAAQEGGPPPPDSVSHGGEGGLVAETDVLASSGSLAARRAARRSLHQAAARLELRGWRATSAGTKSSSQLLALAPSVLHDMAVMVAEAAAAGYLADVDGGLDPAAALRAAAATAAAPSGKQPLGGAGRAAAQPGPASLVASAAVALGSRQGGGQQPAAVTAGEPLAAGVQEAAGTSAQSGSSSELGSSLLPLEASYWPTFLHRQLSSTRQLQRFTNQVVLRRWVHRYYHAVAAMYEDRLDLFGLGPGAALQVRRMPLRRVAELNSLQGPRYLASLVLELADLVTPALRTLWRQASAFVSWLLVRLIGQSLGLIYKGIKLSMDPGKMQRPQDKQGQGGKQQRARRHGQGTPPQGSDGGGVPLWA